MDWWVRKSACAVIVLVIVLVPIIWISSSSEGRNQLDGGKRMSAVPCGQFNGTTFVPSTNADLAETVFGKIDVVFTYVNGSTPNFVREWKRYGARNSMGRYRDYDTLRYALRSVEKFLPFAGNVYLLTNGEFPNWINEDCPRLKLVTHSEVFEDPDDLPTFSSHPIESFLFAIPGLNERFVYCNDDMMFGREMDLNDFWTDHKKTVVYLSNAKIPGPMEVPRNIWRRALISSNRVLNSDPDIPYIASRFYPLHHCYSFRKSILREMSHRFKEDFDWTRHQRFRHPDDVTIPFFYANYVPYAEIDHTVRSTSDFMYVTATNDVRAMRHKYLGIQRKRPKFLCFNDAFHADPSSEALDFLHGWFETYFPDKSCFER